MDRRTFFKALAGAAIAAHAIKLAHQPKFWVGFGRPIFPKLHAIEAMLTISKARDFFYLASNMGPSWDLPYGATISVTGTNAQHVTITGLSQK